MMLILIRVKMIMLSATGIFELTWGSFISRVVRTRIRMEMIPIRMSSFRRLLWSGVSSFFISLPSSAQITEGDHKRGP